MIDWFVGYPKCGNTWVHVLLLKANQIQKILSDEFKITHNMPLFNDVPWYKETICNKRFVKDGVKTVLLIRNPADALVSCYFDKKYRQKIPQFVGSPDDFIRDERWGIERYLMFYRRWKEDVGFPTSVFLIHYEDLHRNIYDQMKALLQWAGKGVFTKEQIQEVIDFCNFESMKVWERTGGLPWCVVSLKYLNANLASTDVRARKVREGKVGGYVKVLSAGSIGYIKRRTEECLHEVYGYKGGERW